MSHPQTPGNPEAITPERVREARERIRGLVCCTPLKPSFTLSRRLGREVRLKLETMQATGAFKLRGAANAVLSLPEEARRRGVVTMSSGNHGRALAYVGGKTGVPVVVYLSEQVPAVKVDGIRSLGAEVVVAGPDQDEAGAAALARAERDGLTFVSAFDHPDVIAGQGTVALEILEQWPEVDTLVVPVSGGGLIGGIAVAARALRPEIRFVGVSQALGPAVHDSLKAGRIVPVEETPSLADALQGAMPPDNRYSFALCQRYLDEVVLVDEEAIARAMAYAFRRERLVVEGGAATTLAALLDPAVAHRLGANVAAVITGDNVDLGRLLEIVAQHPEP